ncbi:DUF5365 family protein [Niallia sp. Krafla_26]|uniref:DUF5365 family protein n=1 Tax=Niallia sp. Krafla_26 TaxID=3064703 RepID=UPI003D1852F0
MKVVFASTPEQRTKIMELSKQIYTDVFPNYFTDQQIQEFEKRNILQFTPNQFQELDTLKDAYQVIASLQTLILILQSESVTDQYMETYYKNISILEDYGVQFPFEFEQFVNEKINKSENISIYTKAANEFLI